MSYTPEEVKKRRKERRKKIRRKRIKSALIVLLILALCVFTVLSLTVLFPVKQISANGSMLYTEQQIIKASKITQDSNIFRVTEKEISQNVQTRLPYIDTVKIKKVLPDKIILNVTDAKEYLCYKTGDKFCVVSKNNICLNIYDKIPDGVFLVKCKKVRCEIGKSVVFEDNETRKIKDEIIEKLDEQGILINEIDVSKKFNITLKIENRFNVSLGENTDLDKKINHLAGMIKNIEGEKTGNIDLSMWKSDNAKGSFTSSSFE